MVSDVNSQGVALCPQCKSVLEFFTVQCPWCEQVFSGPEAIKILSMLAESGVNSDSLLEQLRNAGDDASALMLPICRWNFEKGSQGAKIASLVIYQEKGKLAGVSVRMLERGYRSGSRAVKAEIVKTLGMVGTKEALETLMKLHEKENDPFMLVSFSRWGDMALTSSEEDLSRADIILADLQEASASQARSDSRGPGPEPRHTPVVERVRASVSPIPLGSGSASGRIEVPLSSVPPPRKSRVAATVFFRVLGVVAAAVVILYIGGVKIPDGADTKLLLDQAARFIGIARDTGEGNAALPDGSGGAKGKGGFAGGGLALGENGSGAGEGEARQDKKQAHAPSAGGDLSKLDFTVSASSQHKKYPASNVNDGDPSTVWQEERTAKAIGQSLSLDFGGYVAIGQLAFVTGYDDPDGPRGDMFHINNRLKKVEVRFPDGTSRELEFEDTRDKQVKLFDPLVHASSMVIVVREVYRGSWFADNAVGEIEVFGYVENE